MSIEVTLKNYRCFSDEHPATFRIGDGATGFIGPNHAGKSSLLKFFYEFRDLFNRLGSGSFINFFNQEQGFGYSASVVDNAELFCNRNNRDLTIVIDPMGALGPVQHFRLLVRRNTNSARLFIRAGDHELDPSTTSLAGANLVETLKGTQTILGQLAPISSFWLELAQTTYIPSFRNAINVGTNTQYFDVQTGQSFIQTWQQLKSGPTKSQNEAILKLTDDVRQIFKFPTLEINPIPEGTTLQAIIAGKPYRLPEIGSGLVQFLLALGSVATRASAYVLLDEPELNLHPSLQLAFLTTIASYASKGLCFATHSIGLARAGAERAYSVRRLDEGVSEVRSLEATVSLAEFLGELGFLGYREMGFDKILLVEGPKDLKAIQQFLRRLGKDSEVVLLPLGGTSGINGQAEGQLAELFRMSKHIFAVIDSEKAAEGDLLSKNRADFVTVCRKLAIDVLVLERRAIENYLSERAIQEVKGDKYRALEPFEALKDAQPVWTKEENWRIAREMTDGELADTDLGRFLARL